MENYKLGDYITLKVKSNIIYEILNLDNYPSTLTVKVIHPTNLVKELRENKVFSLKLPPYSIKLLGNPKKNPELKVLYG